MWGGDNGQLLSLEPLGHTQPRVELHDQCILPLVEAGVEYLRTWLMAMASPRRLMRYKLLCFAGIHPTIRFQLT